MSRSSKPASSAALWTRRDLLKSLLASGLLAPLGRGALASGANPERSSRSRPRPRYFLILLLEGGVDPVFTTDPKVRSEVESWVDVPYGPTEILQAKNTLLGPHLAPLQAHASRLAILNGVQVRSANHQTGQRQFVRLRTRINDAMPTVPDILGEHREGQPLGCLYLGTLYPFVYSPRRWFGVRDDTETSGQKNLLELLDEVPPDELEVLSEVLQKQARGALPASGLSASLTRENIEQCAAFFERLRTVPRFREEPWSDDEDAQRIARLLQRTLWLFENDLVRAIYCQADSGATWDSHYFNDKQQQVCSQRFFPMFARFVTQLGSRRTARGTLLDQTLTVMGSELGRYPRLNGGGGKDHFPETPFMFLGGGVSPPEGGGAFGKTGRRMEAVPISLRTGRAVSRGGTHVSLDDVGATVLHLAGIAPGPLGYDGRILDFLGGV